MNNFLYLFFSTIFWGVLLFPGSVPYSAVCNTESEETLKYIVDLTIGKLVVTISLKMVLTDNHLCLLSHNFISNFPPYLSRKCLNHFTELYNSVLKLFCKYFLLSRN